jgi:hypothetical protein
VCPSLEIVMKTNERSVFLPLNLRAHILTICLLCVRLFCAVWIW